VPVSPKGLAGILGVVSELHPSREPNSYRPKQVAGSASGFIRLGKEMDTTYAKITAHGNEFTLEIKEADFIDDWPTLVGTYDSRHAAERQVRRHRWSLVHSWREALRAEGITTTVEGRRARRIAPRHPGLVVVMSAAE
jgi:hypothetical protein